MVLHFMSLFLVVWIIFLTNGKVHYGVTAETKVLATAPLEIVKEGGILSLHCQVWRDDPNQDFSITRRLRTDENNEEKLSFNKNVFKTDRNHFLAHRKLKDGSDVFFLSITDVSRSDEAEYTCTLLAKKGWGVVESDFVFIGIRYFPSEGFPICDSSGPAIEGTPITLNCSSSEPGNPPVNIYWERSGSSEDLTQVAETNSHGVYSQLTFTPKLSDKDVMFVCRIKSKYFPTKSDYKCHVGPLSVEANPDYERPVTTHFTPLRVTEPKLKYIPLNETSDEECHEVCSEMTAESVFRWTIATVISGLLALIFLIFGIILLIRYCFALDEQQVPPQEEVRDMPDLGNVQYRIDGNRLYMTLERPGTSTSQTEAVYQGGEVLERQYILAPPHGGEIDGSYIGTPSRRDSESPYLRTPVIRRDSYTRSHESPIKGAEADIHSMENTTMIDDIDPTQFSYQGTPIRNGGTPTVSVHDTPTRMLMDKVLLEAQTEGYIGASGRRESEGYISDPSRDSERSIYGTPSRGDYDYRQRTLTPTLPPRRYKTHYV